MLQVRVWRLSEADSHSPKSSESEPEVSLFGYLKT